MKPKKESKCIENMFKTLYLFKNSNIFHRAMVEDTDRGLKDKAEPKPTHSHHIHRRGERCHNHYHNHHSNLVVMPLEGNGQRLFHI